MSDGVYIYLTCVFIDPVYKRESMMKGYEWNVRLYDSLPLKISDGDYDGLSVHVSLNSNTWVICALN